MNPKSSKSKKDSRRKIKVSSSSSDGGPSESMDDVPKIQPKLSTVSLNKSGIEDDTDGLTSKSTPLKLDQLAAASSPKLKKKSSFRSAGEHLLSSLKRSSSAKSCDVVASSSSTIVRRVVTEVKIHSSELDDSSGGGDCDIPKVAVEKPDLIFGPYYPPSGSTDNDSGAFTLTTTSTRRDNPNKKSFETTTALSQDKLASSDINAGESVQSQNPDDDIVVEPNEDDSEIMASPSKPAGNLRATSPLSFATQPTKKTEVRRSRQQIDSEFIKKVDDIPLVHNTWEYLATTYGVIKDVNPLVKSSLERSENVAYWLKQKAEDVVNVTKLNEPLKTLDSAAANGVVHVEKTGTTLRKRITETNHDVQALVQAKLKDEKAKIQRKTSDASSAFLEGLQTIMDNLEERLEPVMLKPSPDAEKLSTEPSLAMTLGRTVDMTYRLNLGILQYSAARARTIVNPENWNAFFRKHFSPTQIRLRAQIIRQSAFAPEKELRYMDNKELTELDHRLISLSRYLLLTVNTSMTSAREAPGKVVGMMYGSLEYVGGVLKHLTEARSLNDLMGIGLNESRLIMEASRSNVPFINNFGLLDSAIEWTATQEKSVRSK